MSKEWRSEFASLKPDSVLANRILKGSFWTMIQIPRSSSILDVSTNLDHHIQPWKDIQIGFRDWPTV
jgi:hypothetical protein